MENFRKSRATPHTLHRCAASRNLPRSQLYTLRKSGATPHTLHKEKHNYLLYTRISSRITQLYRGKVAGKMKKDGTEIKDII